MQMRFDGVIGFPGGLVDAGETPLNGVNREMKEEISLDLDKYAFKESDCISVQLNEKKGLVLHFYLKEVSYDDIVIMERKVLSAEEYGIEVI